MNKLEEKINYYFLTLIVLAIGFFVIVGTFAYWQWFSSDDQRKTISFSSGDLSDYIEYDEGESKFVGDFQVGKSYLDGVHTTISINKTEDADKLDLFATINMDINEIGDAMRNASAVKWTLTEGNSENPGDVLDSGSFKNISNGDTISLFSDLEVTKNKKEYTVWIWVDISESPSSELTGEKLDTIIWTQVDQVSNSMFKITKSNSVYQSISATVVNASYDIVEYQVTTSDEEPMVWESIEFSEQGKTYLLEYVVDSVGTYYAWFKDSDGNVLNQVFEITEFDDTAPVCTWSEFSDNEIYKDEVTSIDLICVDEETDLENVTIDVNDVTLSNDVVTLSDEIKKIRITNGYKYSFSLIGKDESGYVNLTLSANKILNLVGSGNVVVTSSALNKMVDMADGILTINPTSYTYDGTAKIPFETVIANGVTLTKDTDYTVKYTNNINAGTATVTITGKGNYTGTLSKDFTIVAKNIESAKITLASTNYTYDGTPKVPAVTIVDGTNTLVKDTDYTVEYTNNINVGTATVTITGKGNYTGMVSVSYTITPMDINNTTVTLSSTSYTYDGIAKAPIVTVKNGTVILEKETDYTFVYSNNINAGTATVKITGKGNYNGTKSINFTIKKASCSCVISSVPSLKYPGNSTGNIVYECNGDGVRNVVSETTSVITVGSIGTTTTSLTAITTGSSKITVSQAAGANYDACTSDSKSITINGSSYNITLNSNGATTNGTVSVVATYNSKTINPTTITLPKREYTVSGFGTASLRKSDGATISSTSALTSTYTFNGWYTSASGGSKIISNSSTPAYVASVSGYTNSNSQWVRDEAIMLYANWSSKAITLPTITKTGYTCGWTTSESGTTITHASGASYTPSSNLTMYAVCTQNSYSLVKISNISNLVTNGNLDNYTLISAPTKTNNGVTHSWDKELNGVPGNTSKAYNITGWGTGANLGVVVPEIGYHAHMRIIEGNNVMRFKSNEDYAGKKSADAPDGVSVTSGTIATNRWLGFSHTISGSKFTAGKKYAITMDVYRVSGSSYVSTGIHYTKTSDTSYGFHSGQCSLVPTVMNEWQTISCVTTLASDYINTKDPKLYVYGYYGVPGELYVDNIRLEEVTTTTKSYDVGYELSELVAPTKIGYTFDGWYNNGKYTTSLSNSSKFNVNNATFKDVSTSGTDAMIYAKWNVNSYNISYNLNGGTKGSSAPESSTYDKTITINNPTKTVTVTGNVNNTGATVGNATSAVQTFAGWSSTTINTSTAYYGSTAWTSTSTKVTDTSFKNLTPINGETVSLVANWTPVSFNLPTLSKTGYTCMWNTKSDGSGTNYSSGVSYTPTADSAAAITLYAICSVNNYSITLDSNGATTAGTSSLTASYGFSAISPSSITLPKRVYTVSGFDVSASRNSTNAVISSTENKVSTYTFNGWYTSASGGSKIINNSSTPAYVASVSGYTNANNQWIKESNVTLYAQWTSKAITLPTITKTGYTCGWSTSSTGTTISYASGASYTPTADIKLYAVCVANSYTVTANAGVGTITSTSGWTGTGSTSNKSVYYTSTYGTLPSPTRAGHSFNGWQLVPNEYQQVDYIQSNGTQYINTGYAWKNENIEIYFDGIVTSNSSSGSLFGNEEVYDSSGNRYFAGIPHGSSGNYNIYLGDGSQGSVSTTVGTRFTLGIKTTADKSMYVYKDGSEVYTKKYNGTVMSKSNAYTTSTVSTTVGHIFLFANHNSSSGSTDSATQQIGGMKVYAFKLYDNGQLVRDLIPCYRKSDNVVGMYDIVNGVFYTNKGTGSFTKGNNQYITSSSTVSVTSNHSIYANWEPNKYTVTYNANGGSGAPSSQTKIYGVDLVLSTTKPTRSGYEFIGWSTSSTATSATYAAGGTYTINESKTLYAVWKSIVAYAVYSADDASLRFYKTVDTITKGSIYNGLTVTEVYTGIETTNYSYASSVPWNSYRANILNVVFEDEIKPKSTAYWFYNMTNLTSINLEKLNTSNVTSMGSMFRGCTNLTSLNLTGWNTSKLQYMDFMFAGCESLLSLDLSHFNTSNVTNMSNAFDGCHKMTYLNMNGWNTSKVTNMNAMFKSMNSIVNLDVSHFNTSNVTDMSSLFYDNHLLTSLDLSNFDLSKIDDLGTMFSGCNSLSYLNLEGWDTSNIVYMDGLFYGCGSLTSLDISNWNTSNVVNMENLFYSMIGIKELDLSKWDTSKVTNMSRMFQKTGIKELDLSSLDVSNVTNMYSMFSDNTSLEKLNISGFNTSKLTDSSKMFRNCTKLMNLDMRNANFSNVTTYTDMFLNFPANSNIIVKDNTQKTWISSKFTALTNINIAT